MSERRILDCELLAKDVVVSHWPQGSKKNSQLPCGLGEQSLQHTGVSKGSKRGPTVRGTPRPDMT
jgi:hypothetical protein